jgi:hypothetical protein
MTLHLLLLLLRGMPEGRIHARLEGKEGVRKGDMVGNDA